VLAIAGSGGVSSAVLAAGLLVVVPSYANSPGYTEAQPILFGILAVVAALGSAGHFNFAGRVARARRRAMRSPVTARVEAARQAGTETAAEMAPVGAG
jgi:hypothetical protein